MKPILGLAISSIFIFAPAFAQGQLQPLSGIKILVNPGHGGQETGAAGATGYFAKDVSLAVSKLLRDELVLRGAVVVMTREDDRELALSDRQAMIEQQQPAIALTIHYTAVPDDEDAENTKGIRTFWYHSQAHSLAVFLHHYSGYRLDENTKVLAVKSFQQSFCISLNCTPLYLVNQLGRSSMGVFWNNLALTRPSTAPSVVMELGFMTNPEEFEWIANTDEQKKLARVLADGVVEWFQGAITPNTVEKRDKSPSLH